MTQLCALFSANMLGKGYPKHFERQFYNKETFVKGFMIDVPLVQ